MQHPARWTSSQPAKRLALMGLVGALLVLAGRSFQPFRSAAVTTTLPAQPQAPQPAPHHKKLGELHGQEFRLIVHATAEGPRYTVISPDGVTLGENMAEADVAREFPGLQLDTMTADAPTEDAAGHTDW